MNVGSLIASNGLCTSCAACSAMCAHDAIQYHLKDGIFQPVVNVERCTDCNLCLQVCPSYKQDLLGLSRAEVFVGSEKNTYMAYSNDIDLRKNSSSGGIVTQLIVSLLEKEEYDKASVLIYPKFNGERAQLRFTSDVDEIRLAAKSKYVPASVDLLLAYMREHPEEKLIITGTPCQLSAIRAFIQFKHLNRDNYFFIGLFCEMVMNYHFYDYIQWTHGAFTELQFRSKKMGGWPGDMLLVQGGKDNRVSRTERMQLKPYFQMNRCRYCCDKLNRHADISVGDCYISGEETVEGKSSVIVRTLRGAEVLSLCKNDFTIQESSLKQVIESQLPFEKEENAVRAAEYPFLYKNMPMLLSCNPNDSTSRQRQLGIKANTAQGCQNIYNDLHYITPKQSKMNRIKRVFKRLLKPDEQFFVLIDHAGFVNRGAQLMLRAVVEQVEKRFPKAVKVIPAMFYNENVGYCIKHHILPLRSYPTGNRKRIKTFVAHHILNKRDCVFPNEIQLILDAGGYHFSDKVAKNNQNYENYWSTYYQKFTHPRLKLVYLPQAFGPFDSKIVQGIVRHTHGLATRLYAREEQSYNYLKQLFPESDKISLYSDFTCLLHPPIKSVLPLMEKGKYIAIVPNCRMVDKTDDVVSASYFDFMCALVQHLVDKGESVILLNHEGLGDEGMLFDINERLGLALPILTNLDAMEVKAIIGRLKMLISSRFHGVVSGLSQGIPTFCTSWSHKYPELLKDYNVTGNLLDTTDVTASFAKIDAALDDAKPYTPTQQVILQKEQESMQMWNEIELLIQSFNHNS